MTDDARVIEALKRKDAEGLDAILGAAPALANARTPEGVSALQLAVYLRFAPGVESLLRAGAQPDIFAAACLGDAERVRALVATDRSLLERPGADGGAPLHLAAHFGRLQAMREILGLGADPNAMSAGMFNNAPLHAAAAGSQDAAVALLLASGAKPDVADKNGYRPLHIAAANGAARVVELLLNAGADPDARGPDGRTALDFARERGHDDVESLLSG